MKNGKAVAVILSVGIGTFMSSLDSSVVNVVMPVLKSEFQVSLSMVEWVVTSYLLLISSLLLTFGRLADLFGHKRVYLTGFSIFVLGSLLCSFSASIGMLIVFRVVQALGAGMMFSTGPAIITNAVPPQNRGKALSAVAIAVALGLITGPVIGGTLTTLLGWQSIFYINVPIGIVGILLVIRNIPKDEDKKAVPFDIQGSVIIFFALLLIMLPLNITGDYNISSALFTSLLGTGILLIVFFVFFELRRKHPMLDMRLFKNRVFAASSAAALLTYMAQFIMIFLAQFYFQDLRRFTPLISGLLYMPMPIATMLIAPVSGIISDRFDSRYISSLGSLLMATGLFLLSFLSTDTSMSYIIFSMAVTGIGFGLFQTPNNSSIMGNVPAENRGSASGTLATMRNSGMALGVALSGALFSLFEGGAKVIFTAKGLTGTAFTGSTFSYALRYTFIIAASIALMAMIASLVKGAAKTEQTELRRNQTPVDER